ncbi:MAG: hypothetical protein SNG14_05555 [Rikenellaceae bacterium]
MWQYLRKMLILVVIAVIAIIPCEFLIRTMKDNPYSYKHSYIVENGERITELILGSSHSYYGVSPRFFNSSAFNLGSVSQPLRYDYELLKEYKQYMPNLRSVILDVSYFSLRATGLRKMESAGYNINYKLYMDADIDCSFICNFAISSPSYFQGKMSAYVRSVVEKLSCDSLGWGMGYDLEGRSNEWDDANAAILRHTNEETTYLAQNKAALHNIAKFCIDNSVELIVITTPTWHTYYDNVDEVQYREMQGVVNELRSDFDIRYFDFFKDSRFVADDFYDSDHLSDVGAEKFTKILADTLAL